MKKWQKITLSLIIVKLAVLVVFLGITSTDFALTGKSIKEENQTYSWTKAVCNGTTCTDYEIICNGTELIKMSPITGAVINSQNWEDPREEELQNRICK